MRWQIQEAKQRFSELVHRAQREGPQVVTRHGAEVAIVMAVEEFDRLRNDDGAFKEFLLSSPDWSQLELERDKTLAREVALVPNESRA